MEQIKSCFEFAKDMAAPNKDGAHNPNAFGGNEVRDVNEIFQGKLDKYLKV